MAASIAPLGRIESAEAGSAIAASELAIPTRFHRQALQSGAQHHIDEAYLTKGIAGRILCKASPELRAKWAEIRLDASFAGCLTSKTTWKKRSTLLRRRRLKDHCDVLNLTQVGRGYFHLEARRLTETP